MSDSEYGAIDNKGHYRPKKRVAYPPIFIWPLKPLAAVKWILSIPGYFLPWNTFYVIIGLLSWFYFSPPLEAYANPTVKMVFYIFCRNSLLVGLYFGAFHYRLYIMQAQKKEFKFDPRWPSKKSNKFMFGNQTIDNIILTFSSGVTIWTGFELVILWIAANGYVEIVSIQENGIYFITMIFLVHFWRDLHFYLIHRLIHFKPLYRIAHRIHHKNINPGPWSGLAMHPIEHIFYFSCALLYLLFPFHPAFIIITLVHAGLSPAPGHIGFERVKISNKKSFNADSYAHYLHHKHFECNYADGILPLDRWFGTFHDGSEEAHKQLSVRLREKRLKK